MNWHLVSYADENFAEQQKFLHKIHNEKFIHHPFSRKHLETTDFYEDNKEILDQKTGAGWWIWKPYYILETLKSINDGDYLIYSDCGDMFSPGLTNYVEETFDEDDVCLLLLGNNINGHYTKKDCFIKMGCDEEDYYTVNQLEAGFMIWKSCKKSIEVVEDWLKFCLDFVIINNDPSILGENLPPFVEHRNDQSILTNLAVREGLTVGGQDYRNYIECDYDYWYERGSSGYGREIDKFLVQIKNA